MAQAMYRFRITSSTGWVTVFFEDKQQRYRGTFRHLAPNPLNVVLLEETSFRSWSANRWEAWGQACAGKDIAEVKDTWTSLEVALAPPDAKAAFARGLLKSKPDLKNQLANLGDFGTADLARLRSLSSQVAQIRAGASPLDPLSFGKLSDPGLPRSVVTCALSDAFNLDDQAALRDLVRQLKSTPFSDADHEIYFRAGAAALKRATISRAGWDSKAALTGDQQRVLSSTTDVAHAPIKAVMDSVIKPSAWALSIGDRSGAGNWASPPQ